MTKISKILTAFIILLFVLALCGCREVKENENKEKDEKTSALVIELGNDAKDANVVLADNKDLNNAASTISIDPNTKLIPVAYVDIQKEEAIKKDGDYVDSRNNNNPHDYSNYYYIAYSFYLKNGNAEKVNIKSSLDFLTATYNIDAALRFIIIQNDDLENFNIYMKADSSPVDPEDKTPYELAINYESDTKICSSNFELGPNEVKKYTILIWLEGWDKECVNSIMSAELKMKMTFDINK